MKVTINETPFTVSIWEGYEKNRLYINRLMGRLASDVYVDLDSLEVRIKGSNVLVSRGWTVTKDGDVVTVVSDATGNKIVVQGD